MEVSGAEEEISDFICEESKLGGPPLYLHCYSKEPLAEGQGMGMLCEW